MTHADDTPLPATSTRTRWAGRIPYLSLPLFLAAIAALVWLTRQYDADEQRATLISDVLWMEQNLRFELDRNEADLQQLGPDLFSPRSRQQTDARLAHLLTQGRGLVRILWRTADGALVGAMPPLSGHHLDDADGTPFHLARSLGRPTYGPAYPGANGKHRFEVHIPVWSDNALKGMVTGVYSLNDLVARDLPWWFSARYRVAVVDGDGREIAAKSKVAPLSSQLDYQIPFEPPGHGLNLQITAYKPETRWIPVLLIASIVLLGGTIVWSVTQLRRQLARRQQAEIALLAESAFRKAMEDSMLTGMRARDLEGRLTYVNSAFCRMTGYGADELVGLKPPLPYWLPNHIEQRQHLLDRLQDTGSTPEGIELRFLRKNGETLDVLLFEAPLIDAAGHHTGWMGSVLDITEQKQAQELARQQEERLQATSRLVTMGEMASTLAHELNQPLTAIASYADGCINHLQAADTDRAELLDIHRKIGRQARRAGEIIRRVHDFVRRSEPRLEPLDLNAVVRDAAGLIEADVRKRRMRLVLELAPGLPAVKADAVMIEQIVVNLVRNGMDAMRDTAPASRDIRVATRLENHAVTVRVSDRGSGIPPDTARRLFEPFFTTKTEGMGMGLNICRSIAELHHGRLAFEAAPGGGTIFTLTLPVEPA
ncbi:sensor histidine kinase [Thauera linaloolentis]|uniref:histidine kinase n=1 Tax=Thauera linaloolentis (strain DSM 12138 / JCM 21573 / CCUG 41526 / CIP 105981 / IAM 15112 / NBRC 102519 / 47Lol) TaxID=1123367 RepID=N6Y7K7_THAL4|nr:ATP-binding protein [Thauera linaloolentis]ENO87560.1 PAS/PAC sensor signal transduction histidine kinase [Thauera linaloolentis 47Lol = DSM 12138]MCM8564144.1 PAS domain S-box protein [Thauera linaloolentis]